MNRTQFISRVEKRGKCWEWPVCRTKNGYGRVSIKVAMTYAHRMSWELHNGPIPRGLHVLHRCDNPPCVNPDHLFIGTQGDNNRDRAAKGRAPGGWKVKPKSHCKNGHPMVEGSFWRTKHGTRLCKECSGDAQRSYRRRLRDNVTHS